MKYLISLLMFTFFLNYSYALELNDTLEKVSVIKHYKKNHLVLNRGAEDGIDKFDHIKLTNSNGYIARAICVRTSMMLSHWKVYRVVNPELLSYDPSYTINSMKQSELPPHIKNYIAGLDKDAFSELDIKEKELDKGLDLQQERIAKFDLANDMIDDQVYKPKESEAEKFAKRNFNSNKLSKDLSSIKFRVFATPIRWQAEDDERSSQYGFNLYNEGDKYFFDINFNKSDEKSVNNITKEEVSNSESFINGSFGINRISESVSYFFYASQLKRKEGQFNNPLNHTQIGPLGFIFHFNKHGAREFFDISYVLLLDNIENDILLPEPGVRKEDNIRHGIRMRLATSLGDKTWFRSTLWYRPLMDTSKAEIEFNDNQLNWKSTFSYNMTEKFFLSYDYEYISDIRRKQDFNRDQINSINTININYLVSL